MVTFTEATALLGLVIAARLIEAMLARRNAERLIVEGAEDRSGDFYLLWMALQGGGLFLVAAMMNPERAPPLAAVLLFAPLFLARMGLLIRYRRNWIARLMTTADGDLIDPAPGQYRILLRGLMAIEAAALPLVLGLPLVALALGVLHVAFIAYRIRLERSFARG